MMLKILHDFSILTPNRKNPKPRFRILKGHAGFRASTIVWEPELAR